MAKLLKKFSMILCAFMISFVFTNNIQPKMIPGANFYINSKGIQIDISSDLFDGLRRYYYYSLTPGYYPYNGVLYYWDGAYWYHVGYGVGWYWYCGAYYWWDGYRYSYIWYNNQSVPLF